MENIKELQIMGQKIKELRTQKQLTQEELANKLGYTSRSTINKIEKGLVDIPQSKIIEIAKLFDTTPLHLLGWENNNDNEITILSKEYGTIKYYLSKENIKQVINYIENNLDKE